MLRKSFKKSRARNIKLKRIVWRANIKRIAIDEVKIWKHISHSWKCQFEFNKEFCFDRVKNSIDLLQNNMRMPI